MGEVLFRPRGAARAKRILAAGGESVVPPRGRRRVRRGPRVRRVLAEGPRQVCPEAPGGILQVTRDVAVMESSWRLSLYRLIHFVTANDFHDLHWNTYVVESRRFAKYGGRTLSELEDSKWHNSTRGHKSIAEVVSQEF